ncbi:unnamed protein product [Staurois parvus]|uniref:Uncharacterized protein n=1 Tax=Staurois parvus TaxID=386267 RepID=A0ABN9DE89_9NEOB|nr:unnamed protein product [Staurois parvus]
MQGRTYHLETRALPEGPGSVGGPMRCPWYIFHSLFRVWARTQGPHDPLLPGCPMSCQSARPCSHLRKIRSFVLPDRAVLCGRAV